MGTSSRLYSVVNANVDQAINYLKSMHVLASNRRQILMVFFLSIDLCGVLRRRSLPKSPVLLPRNLSLAAFLPLYVVTKIWHWVHGVTSNISFWYRGISVKTHGIEECNFADLKEFDSILSHVGGFGHRSTGSEAHENLLQWIEAKISNTPNITSRHEAFDILRWSTQDGASLRDAGELFVETKSAARLRVSIAGVVPFSPSTDSNVCTGEMVYLPRNQSISTATVKGKVILRPFPSRPIPYALSHMASYLTTSDLKYDLLRKFDRPGLADGPLHVDLLEAGSAGAAGVIFLFDIASENVESYFDPHKGVHYLVPAMYVGADEAVLLRQLADEGASATLQVKSEVSSAQTRNIIATLPGQIKEKVVYLTHTDGNTYIQENGPVALIALMEYFARQPLRNRRRTLEFCFNTGHLHISKEGSLRHAHELDQRYKSGEVALVIPMEHLGSREIEAFPRSSGLPGRELRFTGRNEMMIWCVGPSPPVIQAVCDAVKRRKLDRVLVTRGVSKPIRSQVPTFTSFGGIGTYYHNLLVPTTSLISGPWSLWAPNFGKDAVDINRLREQTLALGDIYLAIDRVSRESIAGHYLHYRKLREEGLKTPHFAYPPEIASKELSEFGDKTIIY